MNARHYLALIELAITIIVNVGIKVDPEQEAQLDDALSLLYDIRNYLNHLQ